MFIGGPVTPQELETLLGSPFDDSNVFSFKKIMKDDEEEVFSHPRLDRIVKLNFQSLFIPKSSGGDLEGLDTVLELIKSIGRRDMTCLISVGKNFLGSLPVFMFGNQDQKKRIASSIQRGGFISLGITERTNGSDMLSTKTIATKVNDEWFINGEKWLINNIEIADYGVILARTNPSGGPLGFGLFILDLKSPSKGVIHRGGKIKTHGVRGMLMGSLKFDDVSSLDLGHLGEKDGFQKALKLFQISRAICSSLAIGSVETSLRLTTEFALKREIFGKSLSETPVMKYRLAESYARYLAIDISSYLAARSISYFPEEMSVLSAFAKFFIPSQCENVMKDLSVSYGARNYLRDGWYGGFFQKAMRDVPLISLFDGSTQVNLYIVANQLPQLLSDGDALSADTLEKLNECMNLHKTGPSPSYEGLQLTNRGLNSLLDLLKKPVSFPYQKELREVLNIIKNEMVNANEVQRFHLAERYCNLMAATCVAYTQNISSVLSHETFKFVMDLLLHDLQFNAAKPSEFESVFYELAEKVKEDKNLGVLEYDVASFYKASKEIDFV